jgi:ABC-2 type transport system permease protein
MRGLWKLTWVETKVFLREPMGAIGSLLIPVIVFVGVGRAMGTRRLDAGAIAGAPFNVPVLGAITIAISSVLSLIAIMAIYREGGILKRLRATPLSPITILGAHVLVKLAFTAVSLGLLVLAGRRFLPGTIEVNLVSLTAALLLSTLSILSVGFLVASIVPTARFAQPIGAALFYPMVAVSGLFFPLDALPRPVHMIALALPTTHAVSLMLGVWDGAGWMALWGDAGALVLIFAACTTLASRVFRWE